VGVLKSILCRLLYGFLLSSTPSSDLQRSRAPDENYHNPSCFRALVV